MLKESQRIKDQLKKKVGKIKNDTAHVTYTLRETKAEMLEDSKIAGIMYDQDLAPEYVLRQCLRS